MTKAKPSEPSQEEPFSRFEIRTPLSNGRESVLAGHVVPGGGDSHEEMRRYAEGVVNGLRDAGFPAEVTFVRETMERA